jgi:hypothetical protein
VTRAQDGLFSGKNEEHQELPPPNIWLTDLGVIGRAAKPVARDRLVQAPAMREQSLAQDGFKVARRSTVEDEAERGDAGSFVLAFCFCVQEVTRVRDARGAHTFAALRLTSDESRPRTCHQ